MQDRRTFNRIPFAADVKFTFDDELFTGELLDLSLRGALMQPHSSFSIAAGHKGELSFFLASSAILLCFNVKLMHTHGGNLGYLFLSADIDTMTHLRRLLALNMGDDVPVTQELSFLGRS